MDFEITQICEKLYIFYLDSGMFVNNVSDICTMFNEYLIYVTSEIDWDARLLFDDSTLSCIVAHDNNNTTCGCIKYNILNKFSFRNVVVSLVIFHISKLNSKKATLSDIIPANLLKIGSNI